MQIILELCILVGPFKKAGKMLAWSKILIFYCVSEHFLLQNDKISLKWFYFDSFFTSDGFIVNIEQKSKKWFCYFKNMFLRVMQNYVRKNNRRYSWTCGLELLFNIVHSITLDTFIYITLFYAIMTLFDCPWLIYRAIIIA